MTDLFGTTAVTRPGPALLQLPQPAPDKRDPRYVIDQVAGTYDGMPFWELAPVDRMVARQLDLDPALTEFVWLLDADGQLAWAVVHLVDRTVIKLRPRPLEYDNRHNECLKR